MSVLTLNWELVRGHTKDITLHNLKTQERSVNRSGDMCVRR